jgi:hypothetical protein
VNVHEFIRDWTVELSLSPEVELQARLFYLKALKKSGPRKARLLLFDWLMQVRANCVL